MMHTMRVLRLVCICCPLAVTLTGCLPARQTPPPTAVNAGVDIVAPAVLASAKIQPSSAPTGIHQQDLIDIISESAEPHTKLIDVLRMSGLVPVLQEVGPYTIFAPTDAAFSKLPPGVLDRLLQPQHHAELVDFAKYHLLAGRISFDDLEQTNGPVTTLGGPIVVVRGTDGKVMVGDANVILTNTSACNGNVQWIDSVLLPPG
jgi:uncharacterized surface protein with fasciclin (FAS1) repeats